MCCTVNYTEKQNLEFLNIIVCFLCTFWLLARALCKAVILFRMYCNSNKTSCEVPLSFPPVDAPDDGTEIKI